jgi:hypothetical protein
MSGHHENATMLKLDIKNLSTRISNQLVLIQERAWEGQDTGEAKETLRILQEALKDWCASHDLSLKLHPSEQLAQVWPARRHLPL